MFLPYSDPYPILKHNGIFGFFFHKSKTHFTKYFKTTTIAKI